MTGLLHTHSLLRYFVLIVLIVVIVNSLLGMINRKPFGNWDNKFSLYLLIFTHMQLLVGVILYIVNLTQARLVQFSGEAMRDPELRYWTVEHLIGMLIAVVVITIGRATSKREADDTAKHKRLFYFNLIALVIIVVTLAIGSRGIFGMSRP